MGDNTKTNKTPSTLPTILYTIGSEELEESVKNELLRACSQSDTEQQKAIAENIINKK